MTRAPRLTIATTSLIASSSFACDVGHHHSPVLTRAGEAEEASGTVLSCKFKLKKLRLQIGPSHHKTKSKLILVKYPNNFESEARRSPQMHLVTEALAQFRGF